MYYNITTYLVSKNLAKLFFMSLLGGVDVARGAACMAATAVVDSRLRRVAAAAAAVLLSIVF